VKAWFVFKSLLAIVAVTTSVHAQLGANWSANWIWQTADGPQNTWMCFRKTVTLASAPASAPVRIAADSKYWLWINGELIVFEGQLKRGLPSGTYYDSLNLAPYLKAGNNTVAALVWYWGKNGMSHRSSGRGGFVFDGNFGGVAVQSDATWRARVHPAYQNSTGGGQPNFRLPEFNVRFDASANTSEGWQQTDYDDSAWPMAVAKGLPPTAPWNAMIPRPIPQWKNSGLQAYTNASSLPSTSTGGVIEGRFPYGARVSAYLRINTPTAGQVINIQADQYSGWLDFGDGPSVRTEYVTKAGTQEFETLLWMSGHTMRYTIPAGVTIEALRFRELGYASEFTGNFSSSDPFYTTLWRMAGRTLYINMFDDFTDCPERERALWWGDVVNQLGEVFYTLDTNSHGLIRKAISTLTAWQRSDNTLFAPPSTLWSSELPQQMLASIGWYGFWNYYWNTGDSATIRAAYPAVKRYLGIWNMGSNGLVQHRDGGWSWGDWGTNIDMQILSNTWYYLALKAAIPMAAMSGNAADTAGYRTRMNSIETNFVPVFWNAGGQHFRTSSLTTPDDRANAMAVVAGLAKPQHYAGIRTVLQQRTFASPYMEKYVLEALALMGSDSLALARMKSRYTQMVNSQYSTLWEVWAGLSEGTINHGWNAPNTILSQYIAGLSPTAPGWSRYHVKPQMGNLTAVSQTVPTVKGNITVSDSLFSDRFVMRLESPAGTLAQVCIPKKRAWQSVVVNGQAVWNAGVFLSGSAGVTGAGEDSLYIRFAVEPGTWRFEARMTTTSLGGAPESAHPQSEFVSFRKSSLAIEVESENGREFTGEIFDAFGKLWSSPMRSSGGRLTLPSHFLPEGVFFVRVTSGNFSSMRKFAITR
jgi:alpha-L-rhamnosidase